MIRKMKLIQLLNMFERLGEENKIFVLENGLNSLKIKKMKQKQQRCEKRGHTFGEWIYNEVEDISKYDDKKNVWTKTCSNCQYSETVNIMPEELQQKTLKHKK